MVKVKRLWTQPQLIVLARGMPEETLTHICKYIDPVSPPNGPEGIAQEGCARLPSGGGNCATCPDRGSKT